MVVRTKGTGSSDTHMELKAVTHTKNECSDTHVEMHAVTHTWNRMH